MHLFEFMDLDWLPKSLRDTLRDILECGNGAPFRTYYSWVANSALRIARENNLKQIVELGCGTAPITRHLARLSELPSDIKLVPCDLNPDRGALAEAKSLRPEQIEPILEPVDFSQPRRWPSDTLLLLSATFHHIPVEHRVAVLRPMLDSTEHVVIFEPLQRNLLSYLFVVGSLVPALLTPLWYLHRPGTLRRLVWCWLLPVAPLMFLWDGWASCWREWTKADWESAVGELPSSTQLSWESSLFSSATRLARKAQEPAGSVAGS